MSSLAIGFCGIGAVLALILIRVPIAISLITVSFTGIFYLLGEGAAFGILTAVIYDFMAKWTLTSVPMFLLMGFVCFHSGLTAGLFNATRVWFAKLPGRACNYLCDRFSRICNSYRFKCRLCSRDGTHCGA